MAGGAEITVGNDNSAEITTDVEVTAETGENLADENAGDASIKSGNALAYANLLNLLNTNIVGSNFQLYFLNLLEGHEGDIDFNQIWDEIAQSGEANGFQINEESNVYLFNIQNSNLAKLENQVLVAADTGENQANENAGDASIESGDATALANVVNFVNMNLVGGDFFLGVINILGDFEGDLILPRPDLFFEESAEASGVEEDSDPIVFFSNDNDAAVDNSTQAVADTGSNETNDNGDDSSIGTGEATSHANDLSIVNLNIRHNDWFFLIVNNLGSWLGDIFGWSAPDAQETADVGTNFFQVQPENGGDAGEPEGEVEAEGLEGFADCLDGVVCNHNQAEVENDIQVQAETGDNQANENDGEASIETGNATALANLFNFVNLNVLGSRWFLGLVNVLGEWRGNTIFAYADMTVNLSNGLGQAMVGEVVEYHLTYQNQGYDRANEARIELVLPEGVSYVSDGSGITPDISGQTCSWYLGTVESGASGTFDVQVQVDSDFYFEEPLVDHGGLVRPALAAENGSSNEVTTTALVNTVDPESDLGNNQASVNMLVYEFNPPQEDIVDQRQPELTITAWNNVGEFVYPGDIVTFEITIRNVGDGPSRDTYLIQELFNGVPEEGFGAVMFEIGLLEPGKGAKLSFGLQLANTELLPAGWYHTEARAYGMATNGQEVVSNEARTDFEIRLKELSSLFTARALGKEEDVLGSLDSICPETDEDILPYVIIFLLSSLALVDRSRRLAKIKAE